MALPFGSPGFGGLGVGPRSLCLGVGLGGLRLFGFSGGLGGFGRESCGLLAFSSGFGCEYGAGATKLRNNSLQLCLHHIGIRPQKIAKHPKKSQRRV